MKIGIVGAGIVGSTAAFALLMRGVGREVVLVDRNEERARAEADDLRHAIPFAHPMHVRSGHLADLDGSHVVVVSAGVGQRPGESRLELLQRNAAIFRELIPQVVSAAPDAVIVVATNPVDVLTQLTVRYAGECGVPASRILGSGTTLDTARFRALLGHHLGVDPHHIHAYVIGEHGDSEVLTWSLVTVGGMSLEEFLRLRQIELSDDIRQAIGQQVRTAAYNIIAGKGATYYGIGSALARIVDVILHDQRSILTVCAPAEDVLGVRDVTLALPRLVGGAGGLETFPLPLNESEQTLLRTSATVLREALDALDRGQ